MPNASLDISLVNSAVEVTEFGVFCRFCNWRSLTIGLQMNLMMSYRNYVAVLIIMLWDLQNLYENLDKEL